MTLENRVISAFAKGTVKEETEISLDTKFEEIGIDSTDLLCMIFELEEEFGFEIPQEFENKEFHTVGDVASAVQEFVEEHNIDISEKV